MFGTREPVLPVHTTGRGALEAAICNLFSAGDEIAVCCNGKFGEMWAGFAESYGVVVHRVCTDWTRQVDALEVARALDAHPRIRAVALTYSDTSTGVCNDVAAVVRTVRACAGRAGAGGRRLVASAACRSPSTNGAWTSPRPRRRSA